MGRYVSVRMRSAVFQTRSKAGLLGVSYTINQVSYDLARLRLIGLVQARPAAAWAVSSS